jgi:hypothetical protein
MSEMEMVAERPVMHIRVADFWLDSIMDAHAAEVLQPEMG